MRIGHELRKIRLEKEMTQQEVADRIGISQGQVSMLETDSYPRTKVESNALLNVLGVTYAEVCDRAHFADEKYTILEEMLEKLTQISRVLVRETATTIEVRPSVIDRRGNTALLPVEFSPLIAVRLKAPVGDYIPGDIMFFAKIENDAEIMTNDYLVEKTIAETPNVFLATDRASHGQALGRAIRVLKQM